MLPRAPVSSNHPPGAMRPIDKTAFQIFSALTWGTIMWLFVNKRERLNRGLVSSMDCESQANQTSMCFRTTGTVSETGYTTTNRSYILCTVNVLRCSQNRGAGVHASLVRVDSPLIRLAGSYTSMRRSRSIPSSFSAGTASLSGTPLHCGNVVL